MLQSNWNELRPKRDCRIMWLTFVLLLEMLKWNWESSQVSSACILCRRSIGRTDGWSFVHICCTMSVCHFWANFKFLSGIWWFRNPLNITESQWPKNINQIANRISLYTIQRSEKKRKTMRREKKHTQRKRRRRGEKKHADEAISRHFQRLYHGIRWKRV